MMTSIREEADEPHCGRLSSPMRFFLLILTDKASLRYDRRNEVGNKPDDPHKEERLVLDGIVLS